MIAFDPVAHVYRDTETGHAIPSVTTVIREAGLIEGDAFFTEYGRERGSAIHAACHYLDEGDLDDAWMKRNGELAGYVRAWDRFKSEAPFRCELIEYRVHSALGYCGTLDRTGIIGGDEIVNCLIDLKSGQHQRWHAIQSAAYANALPNPRRYRRLTVRLDKDGTYDTREHPQKQYSEDLAVFVAALTLYNWRMNGSSASNSRAA